MEEKNKNLIIEIEKFIVNNLGINLCSVESIDFNRQDDGQLIDITIKFIPDKGDNDD